MTKRTAIGIGGVIAEIAWLHGKSGFPVDESILTTNLCNRFGVDSNIAETAIDLAKVCGIISTSELGVKIKRKFIK